MTVADPSAALEEEAVDLYLEAFTPEEWRAMEAADTDDLLEEVPPHLQGARVLRVRFHSSRTASREGAELLRAHLLEARGGRRDSILVAAGFPVEPGSVLAVETMDVATEGELQGARLGRFLTLIVLGLMLLGGSAVATDTLAGEKERGTLTTLLTSAATRNEIITAKLLAVMAVALAIALVQMVNLWVFVGLGVIDTGAAFAVPITSELAAGLLLLHLPVVALTAGVLLLTSAHARSYKEAQLYLTPVLMGMMLPALAPLLPELPLRSAIVAVPIANLSLAVRDLLLGEMDIPFLILAWSVTAGTAAWVTRRSVEALQDESLLTGDTSREEFLGGPDLFRHRVLRWFLVFWAVKVLMDFNLAFDDLRVTAFVSVGLVFVAFPALVIRHFRLDPREALALRLPHPTAWVAVALGAPAGLFAAATIFRLADFVIPVPTELVENFGQQLLPEHIPLWHLLIFLAVVPGIAEELTFRGVLLHGLRRRFGPVGLSLVVGLIFGFFHFQIFRIPSTALLGVILTAVTLLTGSILPAIVWHTANNAMALTLGQAGLEFTGESWLLGVAAFAVLGVAFWILWRFRTPYPDVGPRSGARHPPRGEGGSDP